MSTSSIGLGLDALLTIDDPTPANQDVCQPPTNGLACAQLGNNGQTFNQPGRFNVFQGISGGPGTNSITFLGVPVDPAATGSRIYRITNVRIQGPSVPAGAFGLTPVYAYVSASTSTAMTISEATQPIVGFVSQGLNVTATGTSQSFLQCVSQPIAIILNRHTKPDSTSSIKPTAAGSITHHVCILHAGLPNCKRGPYISFWLCKQRPATTATES